MEQISRNPKQIGEAVRRIRRKGKISQRELGDKVGVRQATISSLESGEPGTQLRTLMDVLAALGLELVIRRRANARVCRWMFI
jgi:HTH-type transcriptional regulator/antitoxin HipB